MLASVNEKELKRQFEFVTKLFLAGCESNIRSLKLICESPYGEINAGVIRRIKDEIRESLNTAKVTDELINAYIKRMETILQEGDDDNASKAD